MIETIGKYKSLIIIGIVLVVLALVFGIKDDVFRGSSGQAVVRISGRTYSDSDFAKFGSGGTELASALVGRGDFGMYRFLFGLGAGNPDRDEGAMEFFINRMLLREAKGKLGVVPGDDEISNRIRSLQAFAKPDGGFDGEIYNNFISKGIGRLGLTEKDLRELVSDIIAYEKISEIIGTGLSEDRETLTASRKLANQRISGSIATIDATPLRDALKPTDEEVKAHWELIRDSFMTEEKRKFTYILVTPKSPATPEESKKDAKPEDAKPEDAEEKKAEEAARKEREAKFAEEKRRLQAEVDSAVDDFSYQLEQQKGQGFEELAKQNGWEPRSSALFGLSSPPPDLALPLRSSEAGGTAVEELFKLSKTADPLSVISLPIAVGENQWLLARLDEVEAPRQMTFEEAQQRARTSLINEKTAEALKKAVDAAAENIRKELAAGKDFAAAAAAAGVKETRAFKEVTASYRHDPAKEPNGLFQRCRFTDPGSMAEPVIEPGRAFLIHVASRDVFKDPAAAGTIDGELSMSANRNASAAFTDWLSSLRDQAKVEKLYGR